MMMRKSSLIALVLFLTLLACKKKTDQAIVYGYHYFPIEQGHYVVYDVMDIFHDVDLEPAHDTMRYQIKEVIDELLIDNEGDTIQKIKRYKRDSDTSDWVLKDIWSQKRTPTTAEVVEENDRYIKMVFAIAYNRTWNGNALNNEGQLECYYENIYEPYSVASFAFDSTVIVEKQNFISFIDFQRQYDIYAANVGKIKSVYKDLEIDDFDTLNILKGPEVFYDLVDFGIE